MTYVDLLIVYLACGSPFAVFEATTRENGPRWRRFARVIFSLFFWPQLALILVNDRISSAFSSRRDLKELEELRKSIEARLFPDGSSSSVFEFRDSFYRFAGLEQASLEKPSKTSFEIFKVSGHPHALLASRILARTNIRKIKEHKTRAKDELAAVLSRNALADRDPELEEYIARLSPSIQIPKHSANAIAAETRSAARV